MTPEEVEHACLVRDLAAAFDGFDYKGNAQWSARILLTYVALKKKIPMTTNTPAVNYIKRNHPPLWTRLQPYRA